MSEPNVFISYAHEDAEHEARVLALACQLHDEDGVGIILDQHNPNPPEGWPLWMQRSLEAATHVLMICSPAYYRRVMRKEEAGKGLGVQWEGSLIYNALYENPNQGDKYLPVLIEGCSTDDIPNPARGFTRYPIQTFNLDDAGYEALYRHLTNQPSTPQGKKGILKKLPPKSLRPTTDPR